MRFHEQCMLVRFGIPIGFSRASLADVSVVGSTSTLKTEGERGGGKVTGRWRSTWEVPPPSSACQPAALPRACPSHSKVRFGMTQQVVLG